MQSRAAKLAKRFSVEMSVSLIARAIASRSQAYIIALLESGANIRGHNTLLHTAIATYVEAIQESPIEKHASLLHEGEQVIRLLVDAGVKIDSVDDKGRTALHLAAKNQGVLEDVLMKLGANLNAADNDGAFILEQMIPDINRLEKYMVAGAYAYNTNLWNETILHRLVIYSTKNQLKYYHYTIMMRLFILYGANINAIDIYGRTTLHLAAMNGCIDIVRAILNLQVAPIYDSAEFRGESPAEIKSELSELERALINIAVDVNLDHQDNMGRTALMDSVSKRISALLIVFGADVTLFDKNGQTAMYHALVSHDRDTVALLARVENSPRLSSVHGSLFYPTGNVGSPPLSCDMDDDECVTPQP